MKRSPRLRVEMIGRRFGRLVVLERAPNRGRSVMWRCRCDCGNEASVDGVHLRSGHTASCGCLEIESRRATCAARVTHGASETREYAIWGAIIERCENPKSGAYSYYGGRGIKICERWRKDFAAFLADMGPRPSPKHSIDRIDNNGDYEPGNCRWATRTEQARNKISNRILTFRGESASLSAWAERVGLAQSAVGLRLKRGWSVERALTEPPDPRRGGRRPANGGSK